MNKKNIGVILLIAFVSIALVASVGIYLLDTTGKINQGNFRVNDLVVESKLEVKEKDVEEVKDLSSLVFDISQNNKITMLVAAQTEVEAMYIDNVYISNPVKVGNLYITQSNYEQKYSIESISSQINIYPAQTEGQYKIEIGINNENCMEDVKVVSGTKSIRYDGTILSLLNTKVSDLRFDLIFDLNIIEKSGKKNVCKVKLSVPNDDLMTNGISITREDVSKFLFKVK